MLLAIEGVDGAGKTLQCRMLSAALESRGIRVRLLREPGGTPLGERIRDLLLMDGASDTDALLEALLFSASRRKLLTEKILPGLRAGDCVLLDRSFLSTFVYQGALGGVDRHFLEDLAQRVMGEALPDRILLLDLDAECAKERRRRRGKDAKDGFEGRGDAYLERVTTAFRELAHRHEGLVKIVDGDADPETVHKACLAAIRDLV